MNIGGLYAMKTFFKTSGAILVAGLALAACGSTSTSSTSHHSAKPHIGWNGPKLYLPHVGFATSAITTFAHKDPAYVKSAINPKHWVKSTTFGQYIFVGTYTSTSSVAYQRVRDAKIAAMNSIEMFTLDANYQAKWPTVLNGFNYRAFGQGSISQAEITSFEKSAVAQGHAAMIAAVPNEATIVEAPVGPISLKQMAKSPGVPQQATLGICVPSRIEITYLNRGGYAVPSTALGVSPTDIYFADYGNTDVVLSPSKTTGVWSAPTSSCANFS